ncbi:uncharacterized protein LOC129598218 [Paramacrobiotus metropolitanus]|uniref:uncharacterized protein LOC129598218 n=1 Tax=Paramacrobiotus metropolitanus TaxID=2943436 RepID=UPI002445A887|nr:uncharacterized protein LOC129598218 [Paramacrobiotus metropolitanus]
MELMIADRPSVTAALSTPSTPTAPEESREHIPLFGLVRPCASGEEELVGHFLQDLNVVTAKAIQTRRRTIRLIRETAAAVDEVARVEKNTAIAGGTVSIIGGALAIAGGVVTFATAGAAAVPTAAAALLWGGAGVSAAGGVTKTVGTYVGSKDHSTLMERLQCAIEEDQIAHDILDYCLQQLQTPRYTASKFVVAQHGAFPALLSAHSIGHTFGGLSLATLISSTIFTLNRYVEDETVRKVLGEPLVAVLLPLLIKSLEVTARAGVNVTDDIALGVVGGMVEGPTKKIAFTVARGAAEKVLQEGGDETAKMLAVRALEKGKEKAAAEALKRTASAMAGDAAREVAVKAAEFAVADAAKMVAEEAVQLAVGETAKKAARAGLNSAAEIAAAKAAEKTLAEAGSRAAMEAAKTATKEAAAKAAEAAAAQQAASAAVKNAAEMAAQQATNNVVKVMARVSGGLTIGLGTLFVAWDAYCMYRDCQKESLGHALRRLADNLESRGG